MSTTRYTSNLNTTGGKVSGSQTVYDFTPQKNLSFPVLVVGLILVGLVILFIISI